MGRLNITDGATRPLNSIEALREALLTSEAKREEARALIGLSNQIDRERRAKKCRP